MTRKEAEALRPIAQPQPSTPRARRGAHARPQSMPTFPSSPLSPVRQRLNQLMYQQNRNASKNRIHAEKIAAQDYQEEKAEIARQKRQK